MNILIVAPEYPPRNIGGGGTVYKNLSEALKTSGHAVRVLAGSFSNKKLIGKVDYFSDNGVGVFFIPLLPFPKFKSFDSATYTVPAFSGGSFVLKELLRSKNEVIHLHGLCHPLIDMAAFACMLMRKEYVLTSHGIPKGPEMAGFPLKALFKVYLSTVEKIVMKKARAATVVSRSLMIECYKKNLVNKNLTVVPNGLNRALVRSDPKSIESVEKKFSLKNKQVIFAIGRMSPTKGFQYLIEAMQHVTKKLPNSIAIIAGSGPYKKELEDLVTRKRLSNHVKLIGRINEEDKSALYERSNIVVFPSLQEPFGIVILEAFAMHKPIIAFRTESALEIIKDEIDGVLVPVGDKKRLAVAILRVLTDQELQKKLTADVNKIEAFRWEEIAKKYVHAYREGSPKNK